MGSRGPFDSRIHAARGRKGQIDSAMIFRHLLGEESEISVSHANCERCKIPHCAVSHRYFRACLTKFATRPMLGTEANGVTDNPLVFQDTGDIISGGNFR